MAYYNVCPICGATLDPGEHCDCEDKIIMEQARLEKKLKMNSTGQYSLKFENTEKKGGQYG
ncbi:hypothetical protein OBO34_19335 [Clostridiales Family XIII bacterium ASD5510]|uniref:Uncharacterized protein n=1 Tax=Hominibacterium faecale TaxID=2839743 RepID=A0A9J6QYD4_9FIRM|nr:hypothetical protein [Hominibacterium faecale]MCU7380469.1 hypothetical protein [Hominibacterium faecale]